MAMEKISPALLTFLLNSLWQVTLVASAASLAARLLNGAPARYRHSVWVAALLLTITLPVIESPRLWPVRSKTPAAGHSVAAVPGPAQVRRAIAAVPIIDVDARLSSNA